MMKWVIFNFIKIDGGMLICIRSIFNCYDREGHLHGNFTRICSISAAVLSTAVSQYKLIDSTYHSSFLTSAPLFVIFIQKLNKNFIFNLKKCFQIKMNGKSSTRKWWLNYTFLLKMNLLRKIVKKELHSFSLTKLRKRTQCPQ